MIGYIQRYPFAPRAEWWKRYTGTNSLGKRTIYLASQTLGFEINGFPQGFTACQLFNGILNCIDEVEYIPITEEIDGNIIPTKAIKLLNSLYVFNPNTLEMEEEDFLEEESTLEIIDAVASNFIKINNNTYVRQWKFDCMQIDSTKIQKNTPISGLIVNEQSRAFKTHFFTEEDPNKSLQPDDLIVYENKLYIVEDIEWIYYYTPRQHRYLEFSVRKVR